MMFLKFQILFMVNYLFSETKGPFTKGLGTNNIEEIDRQNILDFEQKKIVFSSRLIKAVSVAYHQPQEKMLYTTIYIMCMFKAFAKPT